MPTKKKGKETKKAKPGTNVLIKGDNDRAQGRDGENKISQTVVYQQEGKDRTIEVLSINFLVDTQLEDQALSLGNCNATRLLRANHPIWLGEDIIALLNEREKQCQEQGKAFFKRQPPKSQLQVVEKASRAFNYLTRDNLSIILDRMIAIGSPFFVTQVPIVPAGAKPEEKDFAVMKRHAKISFGYKGRYDSLCQAANVLQCFIRQTSEGYQLVWTLTPMKTSSAHSSTSMKPKKGLGRTMGFSQGFVNKLFIFANRKNKKANETFCNDNEWIRLPEFSNMKHLFQDGIIESKFFVQQSACEELHKELMEEFISLKGELTKKCREQLKTLLRLAGGINNVADLNEDNKKQVKGQKRNITEVGVEESRASKRRKTVTNVTPRPVVDVPSAVIQAQQPQQPQQQLQQLQLEQLQNIMQQQQLLQQLEVLLPHLPHVIQQFQQLPPLMQPHHLMQLHQLIQIPYHSVLIGAYKELLQQPPQTQQRLLAELPQLQQIRELLPQLPALVQAIQQVQELLPQLPALVQALQMHQQPQQMQESQNMEKDNNISISEENDSISQDMDEKHLENLNITPESSTKQNSHQSSGNFFAQTGSTQEMVNNNNKNVLGIEDRLSHSFVNAFFAQTPQEEGKEEDEEEGKEESKEEGKEESEEEGKEESEAGKQMVQIVRDQGALAFFSIVENNFQNNSNLFDE